MANGNGEKSPVGIGELRRAVSAIERFLEGAPIYLDSAQIVDFVRWSRENRRNTERYVREQEAYLHWWAARLRRVDLHELRLAKHVIPHLDQLEKGRTPRIAALKIFCSWLYRERHELERDPVAALKIPQARPAQWRRRRVVPLKEVKATREALPAWARDAILVLCGTGWHVTELARFAAAGEIAGPPPWAKKSHIQIAGILETVHKHGERWRTPVSRQVLAAAKRVRARGLISIGSLRRALRAACRRAGVDRWTAGRLRHTVATSAVHAGESLQRVAEFLGHRDARTTRRFYVELYTPRRVKTPA